jgi:uncharacterized protein (TIGR02271 family)
MRQTIVGIFDTSEEARKAESRLIEKGFDRSMVDVSYREGTQATRHTDRHDDDDSIGSFFRSLFGGSDHDADKYTHVAHRSGSVVTVHANTKEEAERAADILDDAGAVDVDDRANQYGYTGTGTGTSHREGYARTDTDRTGTTAGTFDTDRDFDRDTDRDTPSVKIIEEDMHVGKRTVQTGGVRLRSRIVERPVEEHLRLRREHVTVNRNPVDRAATDADLHAFQEGEVELTERAEVPVVSKEARVVEEISLNKEVEVHDETIRDTVRKTEVDVEHLDKDADHRDHNLRTDTDDYRTGSTTDRDLDEKRRRL